MSELGGPVAGLEGLLDLDQETGRIRAIERPVIPRHREIADWVDGDAFAAVRGAHDHRLACDRVGREDCDLWLVDDGHRQDAACRAVVRDREGAAADLAGTELAATSAARKVIDLPCDRSKTL